MRNNLTLLGLVAFSALLSSAVACSSTSETSNAPAGDAGTNDASVDGEDSATGTDSGSENDATAAADSGSIADLAFTPGTGIVPGTNNTMPGSNRMLLATSTDGMTFTRANKVITDQAGTPNIVMVGSQIRVYFTAAKIAGTSNEKDGIAVAVSDDSAATWKFYKAAFTNLPNGPQLGDPDVVETSPGNYRLYFTRGLTDGRIGIHYAESTDGFHFTYAGVATDYATENVLDSMTMKIGSGYVQYTFDENETQMHLFSSPDGKTFTHQSKQQYTVDSKNVFLANFLSTGSAARVFAFNLQTSTFASYTTTDGVTLTPESGTRLSGVVAPLEKTFIKDPAVGKLANGTYVMAYITETP